MIVDAVSTDVVRPVAALPSRLVRDELTGVVDAVCARYPNWDRTAVQDLVSRVYSDLLERATVTAHLIPLTLNKTLRLMRSQMPADSDTTRSCESLACPVG
ncbi:hypothetical protein AB0K11_04095 [Mycobacterium sp. NPDC050551]|uniref:hypothetical protein n=1 Tax=Mycobacterium sp. NPDC050551 TaxID=3155407 RepID=UPI0034448385